MVNREGDDHSGRYPLLGKETKGGTETQTQAKEERASLHGTVQEMQERRTSRCLCLLHVCREKGT